MLMTHSGTPLPLDARIMRASMYGASVFLSFFLMLVFMTYNVGALLSTPAADGAHRRLQAYLIGAVVGGAMLGHYIFSPTMDVEAVLAGGAGGKGMACH
jgi:solute carrier family 31 (copper transporter), member 1